MSGTPPLWAGRPLEALSPGEWESLCDRCGKCCLHKLEDEDTGEVHFTNVVCRLFDQGSCGCADYDNRALQVPDCITLTPEVLRNPYWLPASCAYRLRAEGKALPWWHPLVSGDPRTVLRSGSSVCGRVVNEREADDLEHHLITWVR